MHEEHIHRESRSSIVKGGGRMFEIVHKIVTRLEDLGGNEDDLRRILNDKDLETGSILEIFAKKLIGKPWQIIDGQPISLEIDWNYELSALIRNCQRTVEAKRGEQIQNALDTSLPYPHPTPISSGSFSLRYWGGLPIAALKKFSGHQQVECAGVRELVAFAEVMDIRRNVIALGSALSHQNKVPGSAPKVYIPALKWSPASRGGEYHYFQNVVLQNEAERIPEEF